MNFVVSLFVLLATVVGLEARLGKTIDIEKAYKLLVADQLRQGRHFILQPNFINGVFRADDKCELSCPANSILQQIPGVIPDINGCGSYNINIDFSLLNMTEFNTCCDVHDGCYEICTETKGRCDTAFGGCLNGYCALWAAESSWNFIQKAACAGVVKIMVAAVQTFGCSAYRVSRERACSCSNVKLQKFLKYFPKY